ncbi:MAG: mismatch repair protein MutL, partial [Verrucomicrobiales bacterium]|nr:mismatch repair protein MutL [Verrucomicrobiales bacterium]
MNRIRLLPEQVANQIAAGEVVERPASVVKELVENALDAQASRVIVEIGAGGRSLIRVTDNGVGMSKDDALMCLERHATSKIERAEDLQSISTMGFRGEALPSIASVSRFTLVTREASDQSGEATQVTVTGGKIANVSTAGGPPGTSIEVRQLFYNLPARRKFLRTEETESAHIQHYLTLVALARPDVGLTYVRDAATVWQLPPAQGRDKFESLQERMNAVSGQLTGLIPVSFRATLPEFFGEEESASDRVDHSLHIWGLIGSPGISRSTRDDQHLFVNNRPIENRGLNYSLMEGYHTALMKGRYPVCCLFLEMHPTHVDVNIHPSKKEVKFHQERSVKTFVTEAIRQALLQYHSRPGAVPTPAPVMPRAKIAEAPDVSSGGNEELPVPPETTTPPLVLRGEAQARLETQIPLPSHPIHPWPQRTDPFPGPTSASGPATPIGGQALVTPLLRVPLRLVGVVGKLYVVLESDRGLVLLDQHAAHERILFEQMLERMQQNSQAPSQRLLLPETIELS